jgi:diacylglycerol kinase (ATP)
MRARPSNVLRVTPRAPHHDDAHHAGDDPFADIHDAHADDRAEDREDARTDAPANDRVDAHADGQTDSRTGVAADTAGAQALEPDAAHDHHGSHRSPVRSADAPRHGTSPHTHNGSAAGAVRMRYSEHPISPRKPDMRPSSSPRSDAPDAHEPLGPDDPLAPLPFNPYKGNRGVTRAWHAMKNSLAGFQVAIREESAFRQELTLAAILVPCGLVVPVDAVSRVLLLGSVLLVLIVELLNSSVEAAIDRISLERHELSRRAKDLGSAAVMVALFMCVMTWALIVGPLVVRWIGMLLH